MLMKRLLLITGPHIQPVHQLELQPLLGAQSSGVRTLSATLELHARAAARVAAARPRLWEQH